DYTLNHSMNVCVLSVALGYRLGLDRKRLADLGVAALFHDVGKIGIPKEILTKPAKLTNEEFEIIKTHPFQGAEILTLIRGFRTRPVRAILVALEHHMGKDYKGYPNVPIKKDLNLFSKIVTIVDVFDAMTTPRIYMKRAFKRDEALRIMMKDSGKKFDPLLLKAFISMLGLFPIGSLALLNTGELAVVFETNRDPVLFEKPKVKLITDKEGNMIDGPVIDLASRSQDETGTRRVIVKTIDPEKYGIDVTAYF
ncbi:MAG: hypothetical protein DSY91_02040, partial [Deltaproteobacteria bacterium]